MTPSRKNKRKGPSYCELLSQQLKEYGVTEVPKEYEKLFKAISKTYDQREREYKMIDRSVEWSTAEMIKLNTRLFEESGRLKDVQQDINIMFENTETLFFSFDAVAEKYLYVSAACEKIYGFSPDDWKNDIELWRKVIHPDDIHQLNRHRETLSVGHQAFYEYRIIHKNGSIRWVEVRVIPTLDNKGNLIRKYGTVNDITRKKEAEGKLIQTEKLLIEAQQLANMGSWNIDLLKNEVTWSEGLRNIMGVDISYPSSFDSFLELVHPQDKERIAKEIEDCIKTGISKTESTYKVIRLSDKQERVLHSVIRSVKNEKGEMLRMYGISRDITERTKGERKIEQLHMQIYQISHDLRGPLNSAKNYIYLALKNVNDRTAQNYLAKIHDSYAKMEHRVLSLLDLQRINREELNIEQIDLPLLVKDIISSIDGIKGFNEIKIVTDINLPKNFQSDKQFLHSIFHNLISNAITYRRPISNSFIKVSAYTESNTLVLTVSDNGQGVPDNMKANLFKKFVKGDTSANGTGLGLYIVKNLVNKLKGQIDCISEVDAGTSFIIKLPLL